MDAFRIRMSQELSGWETSVRLGVERLESKLPLLEELAIGGTVEMVSNVLETSMEVQYA